MYDYNIGDQPLSIVFPAADFSVSIAQCGSFDSLPPKFNPDYFSRVANDISFEVSSWKTQPLTIGQTAAGALSRRFLAQVEPTVTLATETYVSDFNLNLYPDVTASFSIIVNIKGC